MRELHCFSDQRLAERLVAVLVSQALPATVDEEGSQWVVWIQNDDHREPARAVLATFLANPEAPEFASAEVDARRREVKVEQAEQARRKLKVRIQDRWSGVWYRCFPVTAIMIAICVFVAAVCTNWRTAQGGGLFGLALCNDDESALLNALYIQAPGVLAIDGLFSFRTFGQPDLLGTLRSGEIWRPFTPMFIHLGLLHILFNMMWLRDLGRWIEYHRGSRHFVALVLTLAATSHIAQLYWSGPAFGGMSGVVFGLIGYAWMRGRTEPHQGIGLSSNQVVMSVLWMLLCMGGAFGAIANAAHAAGFVVGVLIGGRMALVRRLRSLFKGPSGGARP